MRTSTALLILTLTFVLPAGDAEAAGPELPILVAIDSSRSLSVAESAAVVSQARELLAQVPEGVPAAVLSFDDEVRWLAFPGDRAAAQAPLQVKPQGRTTVLNDALVEGIRALEEGGVIVLFSDGKDENSATTLEDAVRLASERGVKILAIGAGERDERTLRRLAMLTGGSYAGALATTDAGRLLTEVTHLRDALASEKRAAAERLLPPTPVPTPTPPPTPAAPPPSTGPGTAFLLLALLLTAAAAAIGYLVARRRSAHSGLDGAAGRGDFPDSGTSPGISFPSPHSPLPAEEAPQPISPGLLAELRARAIAPPGQILEVSLDDTASFQRLPFSESAEKTLVLTEETVLTVREPGLEPRSYRLPPDRAVSIGRDSQRNTLAFHDPTLSSQHLRIVLDEGVPYLLDLGSTNGVYLNEARTQSARIKPGDRLRAGMLEIELQIRQESLT